MYFHHNLNSKQLIRLIIDVNISYDVMVLQSVTAPTLRWKTTLFYFFKRSKDEYHFIIYDFSPLKHSWLNIVLIISSGFLNKGTEYNFYLHNLSEVFKRWSDEPVKFAFNANNQGLNSLRVMQMLLLPDFFQVSLCVCFTKCLTHSFQKHDVMKYETPVSSCYFY